MKKIETELPIMILTYEFTKEELPVVNKLCDELEVEEEFNIQVKAEVTKNGAGFYNVEFFSTIPIYGNWHYEVGVGVDKEHLTELVITCLLLNNIYSNNFVFTESVHDLDELQDFSPAEFYEIESNIIRTVRGLNTDKI